MRDKSCDKEAGEYLSIALDRSEISQTDLAVILNKDRGYCNWLCNGYGLMDFAKMKKLFWECSFTPNELVLGPENVSIVRKRILGTKGLSYEDYSICNPELVFKELSGIYLYLLLKKQKKNYVLLKRILPIYDAFEGNRAGDNSSTLLLYCFSFFLL